MKGVRVLQEICTVVALLEACVCVVTRPSAVSNLRRPATESPMSDHRQLQRKTYESSNEMPVHSSRVDGNDIHLSLRRLRLGTTPQMTDNLSVSNTADTEMTKYYEDQPMGLGFLESFRVLFGGLLLAAVFCWCRARRESSRSFNSRRQRSPPPSPHELEPLLLIKASSEPQLDDDNLDEVSSRKKIEEILDDDLWTSLDDDLDDDPLSRQTQKHTKRRQIRRLRPAYGIAAAPQPSQERKANNGHAVSK